MGDSYCDNTGAVEYSLVLVVVVSGVTVGVRAGNVCRIRLLRKRTTATMTPMIPRIARTKPTINPMRLPGENNGVGASTSSDLDGTNTAMDVVVLDIDVDVIVAVVVVSVDRAGVDSALTASVNEPFAAASVPVDESRSVTVTVTSESQTVLFLFLFVELKFDRGNVPVSMQQLELEKLPAR